MPIEAIERGFVWKLHVVKSKSMTACKLMLGSLATHHWVKVSDNHVTNVSDELLKDVLRLYSGNFPEASEKRFTNYTRLFRKTAYVYTDKNRVKGYCLYHIVPSISSGGLKKTAILHSIAVDAKSRGQGTGTRLLQKSITEMRLNSVDRITLYVAKENKAAIELYMRFGFEIEGELADICSLGKKCYKMEIKLDDRFKNASDPST